MRKFFTSILENLAKRLKEKELQPDTGNEVKKTKKKAKIRKKRSPLEPKIIKDLEQGTDFEQKIISRIPRQTLKLLAASEDITLEPDKFSAAFMARQLVQATLPHKNPGNVEGWSRRNGNLILGLRPGFDNKKNKPIGYPYGTIPRLILFWITTEAVRTNNPRIELGERLANFIENLGLNSDGRGKRSDAKRLKEQMIRLFQATISFDQSTNENGRERMAWLNMQVAPKGVFWWDKEAKKKEFNGGWIQLGDDFFKAITSSPVPVDMRALKALKNSPLALDLYAWATYVAYQTQQSGKERSIAWELIHEQFGAEYKTTKEFSRNAWKALRKIVLAYPALKIRRIRGGIEILPSKPAVGIKQKSIKQHTD